MTIILKLKYNNNKQLINNCYSKLNSYMKFLKIIIQLITLLTV